MFLSSDSTSSVRPSIFLYAKNTQKVLEFRVARAIVQLNEPAKLVSAAMVDRHRPVGLATMRS